MYQDEYLNPSDLDYTYNELSPKEQLQESKNMDRGYNVIYRRVMRKDGKIKNKKIEIYTTSGIGSRIRDAETGDYYQNIVGSKDEDLFFKVGLSTGECKSANGSSTLFFLSPQHYATHLHCELNPDMITAWEEKRNARLAETKTEKIYNVNTIEIK